MSERLDRIESILDRIAQRQEESDRKFEETKAIVQSNARAIQAMLDRQESERLEHEENIARIDTVLVKLTEVQQGGFFSCTLRQNLAKVFLLRFAIRKN